VAVQWLRLCASSTGDVGSILGLGTKVPHAVQPKKKKNFFFNLKKDGNQNLLKAIRLNLPGIFAVQK